MADMIPIGFRFCPSDEQLFLSCLARRVQGESVFPEFIDDFDVYKMEPWKFFNKDSEKSLYVFTKLKMKKSRAERTAGSGYWKGVKITDIKNCDGNVVGHKKHFNFKVKGGSSSDKGSWIMHEYSMLNQEIVLCKIRYKKEQSGGKQGSTLILSMPIGRSPIEQSTTGDATSNAAVDHQPAFATMDEIISDEDIQGILNQPHQFPIFRFDKNDVIMNCLPSDE